METTLDKPYLTSWLTIPVLILVGFAFSQHTLDVQLYDTYFVVGNLHFVSAASLLLLLIGLGYWLVKRQGKSPNRVLTVIHLSLTVGILLLFAMPISENSIGLSGFLAWSVLALLMAQVLYLVNLFVSLIQERK